MFNWKQKISVRLLSFNLQLKIQDKDLRCINMQRLIKMEIISRILKFEKIVKFPF